MRYFFEHLLDRDQRESEVNGEALRDLIFGNVGWSEEGDLGGVRPTL